MAEEASAAGSDQFRQRWHRLYLDTAELNEIARNRVDAGLLRDLIKAFEDHAVIVVLSLEHMRDAMKPGDANAPGRLADALEQFPLRGLVSIGPDSIEPWSNGPADIKIDPWSNVREVLLAPAAAPALETQAKVQDAMFAGDLASNASFRETRDLRPPRHHHNIVVGTMVTLMHGWMGDDVGTIVDMHASKSGLELTSGDRSQLIEIVAPVVAMLRHIGPLADQQGIDRTEAVRRASLGPDRAPGFWLAGKLVANRMLNVTREPMRSDSIDVFHTAHFPYVDIATCDRQTFDAINRFVAQAQGSRAVSLRRNGRLREVLADVLQLPTGEDLARLAATASD